MTLTSFAVISDLHANLEALDAVWADLRTQGDPDVVCLGDIVGYGPNPNEVVDAVRERAKVTVAGNHDWALLHGPLGFNRLAREVLEYTREIMEPRLLHLFGKTKERWDFLECLPLVVHEERWTFVHGSLRDPLVDYVFGDRSPLWNPGQIEEIFPKVSGVCFSGHSHVPVIIRDDLACWYPTDEAPSFEFEPGRRYIVNVGSVGQPRDGDPRACYAVVAGDIIRFRRVEYDVEATRQKILDLEKVEDSLGERLVEGR